MVRVLIHSPAELNHSSYVHTGLFELEERALITCNIKISIKKDRGCIEVKDGKCNEINIPQPKTSYYELIDDINSKRIKFVTDLYDNASKFSKVALDTCDYIFKRNYQEKYVECLPEQYKSRIFPLGLTFGCSSRFRHSDLQIYIGNLIHQLQNSIKLDRMIISRMLYVIRVFRRNYKDLSANLDINDYNSYSLGTENRVIFQTRCFQDDSQEDVKNIHLQRNEIITELKNALGEKFYGGFIPSSLVNTNYRKNISDIDPDRNNYLIKLKAAKIAIYTRGLVNSPAWKMAEYLSQGKAILAERLLTDLPFQLQNEKHLLYFDNAKDCAKKAKQLINNQEKINYLSNNAREYYKKYVDPEQNVRRIIEIMLGRNLTR